MSTKVFLHFVSTKIIVPILQNLLYHNTKWTKFAQNENNNINVYNCVLTSLVYWLWNYEIL